MFGLAAAGVILLGCAPRAPAAAGSPNPAESCRFWSDKAQAKTFDSLAAMPEPVWRGMAKLLAPDLKPESLPAALPRIIAAHKGKWQATDVVIEGEDLPWRRFIRGIETSGDFGENWYVWFENGGFVRNTSLAIFRGSRDVSLLAAFTAPDENLCSIARLHEDFPFFVQTTG
ncbi:MAG: hypothetical protein ACRC67_08510 [Inquilinus sp.]|uniref:hypothetical protein n=1 Tax=Inquilinus sp. TaxID=1932117 RepID=UPI003F337A65